MLPLEQQIVNLIHQHHNILVCLPAKPSTDAIAAGLAMYTVLQKLGKNTNVVAAQFTLPDSHKFLPKSSAIKQDLQALKKFIITLNTEKIKVSDLQYAQQDKQLHIYVTPQNGSFNVQDVTTSASNYAYDLIITIDTKELDAIGTLFEQNADFFYHTPIINIDHHPGNEQFGQVNLVNITATSVSEIIFELIQHLDNGHLLDEYIATNLLTGIISKTKSFKTASVTPRSLAIASHLIASGARREDIVKNLYQTKTISTLHLWGRALAQLQSDTNHRLVWSVLHEEDFLHTNTNTSALEAVIDELIINAPEAENVYIIYEQRDTQQQLHTHAIIYLSHQRKALNLPIEWQVNNTEHFKYIAFPNHITLDAAQTMLHQALEKLLPL
ncbi:MAG: DHH family phosphoesterase [Patescibacteria group bacterium]